MIQRFQSDPSVNFIILSPDVAGVGLTLVEANHVIHYGRWWNPAKESQATDRVYRLGQTKEVHVYYLIAKDPEGEFQSFDEKLDALIDRRLQMATDFLMPLPEESLNEAEFCKDIFENDPSLRESISAADINLLTWERFESLIGILEEKTGNRSVVTPRSGDLGIDVVSINGNTVRLIQCKHTCAGREIDPDVIDETINAFDNYRAGYFTDKEYNIRRVIATNASIPPRVEKQCRIRNIEFMNTEAIASLLEKHNITMTDIDFKDRMRLNTMSDLSSFIANG